MQNTFCRRNKYGFCKYGDRCHFRHAKQICINSNCDVLSCENRHPRNCKWYQEYNRCKFTTYCKFKHVKIDSIENLMDKIKENSNELNELAKKLEKIEKVELDIQKRIEAYEDQIEKKLDAFEIRLIEISMQMKEKDNKIASLENCLKETGDMLEKALKAKDFPKEGVPSKQKFKCAFCEFQSTSSSGLKIHISRKHTNYIENDVPLKCEICVEEFKTEKDLKDHAITHTYSKSEFLKFKCYECDFWGPTAQTMKMHFRRVHSENISCGICNLEVKDIETLDIHTFTCERFQCNWCAKSFNNVSDMKIHGNKEHKGRSTLYHYKQMRINEEFFSETFIPFKNLV